MSLHHLILCCFFLQRHKTISQTLNQGNWETELKEGASVRFSCRGEQLQKPYYFFWYQQQPGQHPVYIQQISYLGDKHPNDLFSDARRFSLRLAIDKPTVVTTELTNDRTELRDSAAYLCAINHMSEKYLQFGDGNRLRLRLETDAIATAYLQHADTDGPTACMVRDSGPAEASVMLSGETVTAEPTLVTGESSYGLVGLGSYKASHCQVKQGKIDIFASEAENKCLTNTDERMNFLQLTLFGLRLLFVKMVVLSGLLTIDALTYSA